MCITVGKQAIALLPRRAAPPKSSVAPAEEPELPAAEPLPKAVAATPAVRRKAAPKTAKPLIVEPEVPAVLAPPRQGPPRRTARITPVNALPPATIPREALASPRH